MSTRSQAREAAQVKYLGTPCPHCASPVRYTSSTKCVACIAERDASRPDRPRGPANRSSRQALSRRKDLA